MIRIKNHKQQELFDPWAFLSPKRRSLLDKSWSGLFKHEILSELPVRKIIPFFDATFGRPTKELYTVLGVLILQQTFDLSDDETVDQFSFNIQWHYALNITEESDSAKYMCHKTLWNMRSIIVENGFEAELFKTCTDKLAKLFQVNTDKQRIDSVHIKSNMRKLGRIGIFATGIHKFLTNLKRQHLSLFATIDTSLVERYLPEKAFACFSMVKPSEAQKTLTMVSNDLFDLTQQFKGQPQVAAMNSYKLLYRILKEQCDLTESNGAVKIEVKKPKEIPSDSLQNPSDPDASYSGHKGQGYQVQIMETYTDDESAKAETLNLITHVEVERAHESDANALLPAIQSSKERGLSPKEVLADSLYGSDDNKEKAELLGVELVAPTMGAQKKEGISLSKFVTTQSGEITACPQGHTPVYAKKKKDRYCAAFNCEHCSACPQQDACPTRKGKKSYRYLRYREKEMRIDKRRTFEQTGEFKDRYRWRSGVEATMSEYNRRTGVKRLRVRGLRAVRYCATLKAIGVNLLRAALVWIVVNNDSRHNDRSKPGMGTIYSVFKERFLTFVEAFFRCGHRSDAVMGICS